MGRHSGRANERLAAVTLRRTYQIYRALRRAMRRRDVQLEADIHASQHLARLRHHGKIGVAAHQDQNLRLLCCSSLSAHRLPALSVAKRLGGNVVAVLGLVERDLRDGAVGDEHDLAQPGLRARRIQGKPQRREHLGSAVRFEPFHEPAGVRNVRGVGGNALVIQRARTGIELDDVEAITGGEAVTRFESEDPIWVFAPEKVVESVVGNLVRNAVTYTGEGEVLVKLSGDTLLIQDTGPGMDSDQMKNLFKPFVRRQRQRGGFGVGLTIVKRLTGRFEWPLDVESQLGQGTRVTVRFPNARRAVPKP